MRYLGTFSNVSVWIKHIMWGDIVSNRGDIYPFRILRDDVSSPSHARSRSPQLGYTWLDNAVE